MSQYETPPLPENEANLSSELLDVVLGLVEQAKEQDKNAQKNLEKLERALMPLNSLQNDIKNVVGRVIAEEAKNAIEKQHSATEKHLDRIDSVTSELYRAKRELSLQNGLWYFGGFTLFFCFLMLFVWWLVPSMDEIQNRRRELAVLTTQVEQSKNLKHLQFSSCDKQLCIKVDEKQCNYGKKGERYCVAELDWELKQ